MGCFSSCTDVSYRILLLGNSDSSRHKILEYLRGSKSIKEFSSQDFSSQTIKFGPCEIVSWNLATSNKVSNITRHYFEGTKGLSFVIDALDSQQIDSVGAEIGRITSELNSGSIPILIVIDNWNAENAMTEEYIKEHIHYDKLSQPIKKIVRLEKMNIKGEFDWLLYEIKGLF